MGGASSSRTASPLAMAAWRFFSISLIFALVAMFFIIRATAGPPSCLIFLYVRRT